jgi:hypothetical protein
LCWKACTSVGWVRAEEVTALAILGILAGLLPKALQHAKTLDREPHIDFGAELVAHPAGAAAGGALAEEGFALQQQHIPGSGESQVVGGAGAHHPAADDND